MRGAHAQVLRIERNPCREPQFDPSLTRREGDYYDQKFDTLRLAADRTWAGATLHSSELSGGHPMRFLAIALLLYAPEKRAAVDWRRDPERVAVRCGNS